MRQQNNLKLEDNKHILYICSGAAFVLIATLFVLNFLHIFTVNSANAESTASKTTDMAVTLQPTLEIWTTDTTDTSIASLNIVADPDAAVYTGTVRAHVSTNNETGYTLTMTSSAASAAMVSEDTTRTIAPISGADVTTASWRSNANLNNQWAFSIGSNDAYNPVVGSGDTASQLNTTAAAINDSTTDVVFGAKVDESLPAGTYTNTVIFSAVANAPVPTTINMQDFTAEQCSALAQWTSDGTEGDTLTVVDSRDSKEYSIRRLADGHCWMVDNLAITNKSITTEDSDSAGNFTIPATSGGSSSISWTNDYANPYMHIGNSTDDSTWTEGYGPYYNWNLATAGQGVQATSASVNYSICPKGWKLPLGDTADYSWYYLYNTGYGANVANFQAATKTGTGYLGGYYNNGALDNAGSNGYWWSRTPYSSNTNSAYNLNANSTGVSPQNNNHKRLGFAIRCVFAGS